MTWFRVLLICFVGSLSITTARAEAPTPARVDLRFLKPLDLSGEAVTLSHNEDRAGTAFVFISSECPLSRQYIPELNRLASAAPSGTVDFYGILSDRTVDRAEAVAFAEEFDIQFPVLFDATGELAERFRPTHVPQAFLVNASGDVVYQGRIDNTYAQVDKRRLKASKRDLFDAINALAAGEAIETPVTETVGCLFEKSFAVAENADVTYTRDVAPILFANCVECHRPGEVAPFSLLTYEDAAKRAEWLAEVTSTGLMPPWRAEIGYGHFVDERRLTDKQIAVIQQWAENGTPRGDEADMPPEPRFASGWRLGEPDLVVEAPTSVTVPADGPDIFHHWVMPINIPEGKTVIGYEFRPGNPAVVHHAILGIDSTGLSRKKDEATPEPGYTSSGSFEASISAFLGVWTPGMTPRYYPDNVGIRVEKNSDILLQLHLHPTGKVETDVSRVALYFADEPVEEMKTQSVWVMGSLIIDIPPGEDYHKVSTSMTLPIDLTLTSVFPHLHLIGKEMKIIATLPDGSEMPLIWIKDWNFYWQDIFVYREPVTLPKGTRIDVEAYYDNSADNPFNPHDPPEQVLFGNDSDNEMCFAIFQTISDSPNSTRELFPAMMMSFMRDWQSADLSPEVREHIVDEASKLFGAQAGTDTLRRIMLSEPRKRRDK